MYQFNKILYISALLFITTAFTQDKKQDSIVVNLSKEELAELEKASKQRDQEWPLIVKYIEKQYIEKADKEIPKLEKAIQRIKDRISLSKSEKTIKRYKEQIKEYQTQIEVHKLWKVYVKAYVIYKQTKGTDNNKRYQEAKKYIFRVKSKYQKLTSERFPNAENEFYQKYGKKLAEKRKANQN